MAIQEKIRGGQGRFWGSLKRFAKFCLSIHLPASGLFRLPFAALYSLHVLVREAILWVLRFFWFEPLFRSQCESVGTRFRMESLPYLVGQGRIVIGSGVRLSGKSSFGFANRYGSRPELVIGDDVFIGHGCSLTAAQSIRIGDHALIAGHVQIQDIDGHPLDAAKRRAHEPTPYEAIAPVSIGDDVWIGTGAVILKGVVIGDRSVVGARAVVTKPVPPDVVVAGNPAKIVRRLNSIKGDEMSGMVSEVSENDQTISIS